MNIRDWVIDQVKPLLPRGWRLIPYSTNLDVLSTPVVMLKLQSIARTPEAPNASRTAEFVLTIIEPKTDPQAREDALDDNLLALIYAIDKLPSLKWTKATRALFADNYLAEPEARHSSKITQIRQIPRCGDKRTGLH